MQAEQQGKIRLSLNPLRGVAAALRRASGGSTSTPEIEAMYRQWTVRYLSFARRRYANHSRGGGDWQPLAPSTVRGRRRGGKPRGGVNKSKVRQARTGGNVAILRDTGTLLAALDIGRADNFRRTRGGVRVGFLGRQPAMKRTSRGKRTSRMTIAGLAAIHHRGTSRIPARPVIVNPDQQTFRGMLADKQRAMRLLMARYGRRATS